MILCMLDHLRCVHQDSESLDAALNGVLHCARTEITLVSIVPDPMKP